MADQTVLGLAAGALTIAAVEAGLPLAIGFCLAGSFGAIVGHARWTLERERVNPEATGVPIRRQVCMMLRALIMALFVSFLLLLLWLEFRWPWTWGMIITALASVFASDAIEQAWLIVRARAQKHFGR